LGAKVLAPFDLRKASDPLERENIALKLTKRSAIEPIIGHLKTDYGLNRNLLHGIVGDSVNSLSAAIGFNLKKFININGPKTLAFACSNKI
jgi:IS5 family transposase